ncbi:carbonic anhydrase-like isoform X2 [Musca autumnalis]|uniref:carbonic anhydrase-like isoform X2 n=1 Tax=Musca autumnalis TaxID=221902 RepID=UPI003CEFA01C
MMMFVGTICIILLFSFIDFDAICRGKYNIPLNSSKLLAVEKRNMRDLEYKGVTQDPLRAKIKNTGETLVITLIYEPNKIPTISKGPLENEVYRFEFMYFHWLNGTTMGEEMHGPQMLPAELHMVFVNSRYANYDEASLRNFGVVITAYKHEVTLLNLPGIIYEIFTDIPKPNDEFKSNNYGVLPLYWFAQRPPTYKLYLGHSVYPHSKSCSHTVIWIEYDYRIPIDPSDLKYFPILKSTNGVPLMNKIVRYIPPNTTIYEAIDRDEYKENGWIAEQFEGLGIVMDTSGRLECGFLTWLVLIIWHVVY